MLHADLYVAGKYCRVMRDMIVRWQDERSLGRLKEIASMASSAVDDDECRELAEAIVHLGTDLFSSTGHQKWAHGRTSGKDFLRLRILREIKAFEDRLAMMAAMRAGSEQMRNPAEHQHSHTNNVTSQMP